MHGPHFLLGLLVSVVLLHWLYHMGNKHVQIKMVS